MCINGYDKCGPEQPETHDETEHHPDAQVTVVQHPDIDDREPVLKLAPDKQEDTEYRYNSERDDELTAEPIVFLALFEHKLQGRYAGSKQADAQPVYLARRSLFFVFGAAHILQRKYRGHDADRDIDVENERPGVMVDDVSAQGRA